MNNHKCQICQKPLTRNQSKYCSKKCRTKNQNTKRKEYIHNWYLTNRDRQIEKTKEWRQKNHEEYIRKGRENYRKKTEGSITKSLECKICKQTFTTPHARASHERAGHNPKFREKLGKNLIKHHKLQVQTNNQLPQLKDYLTKEEHRKAYIKRYKELFPERQSQSDKKYHTKPEQVFGVII